jgi:hypothetical protein
MAAFEVSIPDNIAALTTLPPSEDIRTIGQVVRDSQAAAKAIADFYAGPADINVKLAVAVQRGDADVATDLVGRGADVNAVIDGRLPLVHEAAGWGYREIVEILLTSGRCDLTARDFAGRLASDLADRCARDAELAERLTEEEVRQFREKNMDPRSPDHPDYGNWTWS